jgi:hypothetical protein
MKTLVVYYSRTGRTRAAATRLAAVLNADLDEIHDVRNRSGVVGYLAGGRDAWLERETGLAPPKYDPSGHDLVVLAGPVWAFTICPAMRAYLRLCAGKIRQAAFLCTQGGRGSERAFTAMEALLGKPPVATLTLIDREIDRGRADAAIEEFAGRLRAGAVTPAA